MFDFTINTKEGSYLGKAAEGETVLEVLRREKFMVSAPCGGRGTCGKCKVRIVYEEPELRLACQTKVVDGMQILWDTEEMQIVTEYGREEGKKISAESTECVLGIDIGTTTVAMQLVACETGIIVGTYATANAQISFGMDVITRIAVDHSGNGRALQEIICGNLRDGWNRLMEGNSKHKVGGIVIAGNSAMIHFLFGYPAKGLGVYPFVPYFEGWGELELEGIKARTMPALSAFVGGDIISGLYACGFARQKELCVFLDLGTNAEMAIGNEVSILATSAAAGPAFEGGSIFCGMASVEGAISDVRMTGNIVQVETIGGGVPIGVCGSGLIAAIAELRKYNILDETGLLLEAYWEEGYPLSEGVYLTQKDIREFQMAKAAVWAGLLSLVHHYGIEVEEVEHVYVAGGFGQKIDFEKAMLVGLLPKEWKGKYQAVGNTSLQGSIKLAMNPLEEQEIMHIMDRSQVISLAEQSDFQTYYFEGMNFK